MGRVNEPARGKRRRGDFHDDRSLYRDAGAFDPLINRIGDARYILVDEASHGTSEFYRWRAELTKRLVAERGFSFVAVEGDWTDGHRMHRAASGEPGAPDDSRDAQFAFERWPTWMWANEEVCEFARWLRGPPRRAAAGLAAHTADTGSPWGSTVWTSTAC